MNRLAVLLCLLAVSVASAQWVETTIGLPDSLGVLNWPRTLLYDSLNNTVYVGGDQGRVCAILDAATGRPDARVRAGANVRAFCGNPARNKVYAADLGNNTVTVIDAATRQVTRRVPVGSMPAALTWVATTDRVYCANYGSNTVSVIDCATDSVIATVGVGRFPLGLCCDPIANKVYCANSNANTVSVIDGNTNQVVKTDTVGVAPIALIHNFVSGKVYVACIGGDVVSVIRTANDSVVASCGVPASPRSFCFNPSANRVYVACEDGPDTSVAVVDGISNTVVRTLPFAYATSLVYSPESGRVYCASRAGEVACFNAATDSLLALGGGWDSDYEAAAYDPVDDRLYCAAYMETRSAVDVFGGTTLEPLMSAGTRPWPQSLSYNKTAGKLYCADGNYNTISVVNGMTNEIAGSIWSSYAAGPLAVSETENKLYSPDTAGSCLDVIDCAGDTIIGTVPLGFAPTAVLWNPVKNRLYCASSNLESLVVVDCATDSVIASVQAARYSLALCVSADGRTVFCTGDRNVALIDADSNRLIGLVPVAYYGLIASVYNRVNGLVYTAGRDYGWVYAIGDTANPRVVDSVDIGGGSVYDLCYYPRRNKLYCTNRGLSKITVIDCNTNEIIRQMPASVSSGPMICDTLNGYVYVANAALRVVSVLDAETDSAVAILPAGDATILGWNPVDLRVYAANYQDATITVIRDSLHVGLAEGFQPLASSRKPAATVVRGVLWLPPASSPRLQATSLLDIAGRSVMNLRAGANDVRRLAPGVYFLHEETVIRGQGTGRMRKVVVTR